MPFTAASRRKAERKTDGEFSTKCTRPARSGGDKYSGLTMTRISSRRGRVVKPNDRRNHTCWSWPVRKECSPGAPAPGRESFCGSRRLRRPGPSLERSDDACRCRQMERFNIGECAPTLDALVDERIAAAGGNRCLPGRGRACPDGHGARVLSGGERGMCPLLLEQPDLLRSTGPVPGRAESTALSAKTRHASSLSPTATS